MNRVRIQCGDARTCPDTAPPGLWRIRHIHVIRKRLNILDAASLRSREVLRIHSETARKMPVGVVCHYQIFRALDHVPSQWQPIEVRDDKFTARLEEANHFGNCPWLIEPVPTLTCRYDISSVAVQTRGFGLRLHVRDAELSLW